MSQEREDRFQKLLAWLRHGDWSSKDFVKRCRKCPKTIQRDLQFMRDERKWPIAFDKTKKKWRLTEEGFFIPLEFASNDDLQAILVLGELVSHFGGTPLGASMKRGFDRILELFKNDAEGVEKIRKFARRVCFAGAPSPRIDPDIWKAIIVALQSDQGLEIEYRKGGSGPALWRKFDPYGLIVRNRDWFLRGYCHQKKVTLNLFIPYITQARIMEDMYFDLPADFDLSASVKRGFMGMEAGKVPLQSIVLRFSPEAAGAAESAPFMPDQKMEREPTGHLKVTFQTNVPFLVQRELMRWGADVEVLEPAGMRSGIREFAEEIVELYSK